MDINRLVTACLISLAAIFLVLPANAQNKVITGKVLDGKDGTAMPNVTVSVKGTKIFSQTDNDGIFKIRVPETEATLIISSIGYLTQEIKITSTKELSIQLIPTSATLRDVVVIGYGTIAKKEVTGSIATVSAKDFQHGTITTPDQLIAGKVAGVSITPGTGEPGSGGTIRIRGGASLNASNDPLIVIDGVPLSDDALSGVTNPLALINPADIETFSVLKDAASTAIYGSRASNGVIMITTKKGRKGKAQFNFSTSLSLGNVTKKIKVMDANTFRTFVDTIARNEPTLVDAADTSYLGSSNTNWQNEIYQTAVTSDNNLSITGAIKDVPYRVSLGYLNQTGTLKTDQLQRYSAALRMSPVFFDNHLKVDINLNGSATKSNFANQSAIGAAVAFDPTQSVYSQGSIFGGYFEWRQTSDTTVPNPNATRNPVAYLNQYHAIGYTYRSYGNVQFDYKVHFLPDLHANLNLGYDIARGHGTTQVPADAAQSYRSASAGGSGDDNTYKQHRKNSVLEFYMNYTKDLASIKSTINATAGYGYYDYQTPAWSYYSYNAAGDTIPGSAPQYNYDNERHTLVSYYGRLIYTFYDRYILAASLRKDGSSKFSSENRWGTFPSIALTWRINQENFLKNSPVLSDLKLRLSYGVTGQQDGISNYSYIPTYTQSSQASEYQIGSTYYYLYSPSSYISNLKWEQTSSYNVGIDYGFLNNRINGSIEYYYKKTKNLLGTVTVAAGTNFSNTETVNVGNMESRGVEFNINATPIQTKKIRWDVGFNISYNKFKITNLSLPGVSDTSAGVQTGGISGATGSYIQIHSVGYTPYSFYVYQQAYDNNGKPIEGVYVDRNKDGVVNSSDMYRYKSPFPKYTLGFSTSFTYDKWTLSTVLRGSIGNYIYDNVSSNRGVTSNVLSSSSTLNNATMDIFNTHFYNNQYFSDYYVKNGSFLKMDNLGLSYNVGEIFQSFSNKARLLVTLNCQNVFVITKYKGVDPEIYGGIDNSFYPRARVFTLNMNLAF